MGASGGTGGTGGTGGSSGGTGGTAILPACDVSFTRPLEATVLTHLDDANSDRCADGFQYDVEVTTDAPAGTAARLFANAQQVDTAAVEGGSVRFEGVQLPSQGQVALIVVVDWSTGCETQIDIEVDCGVPTCDVVRPVIGPMHPKLNGVLAAEGGDRVSPAGTPYQAAFEVETDVADGQPVLLRVDDGAAVVSSFAQDGLASFPAVTLDPDGTYAVEAVCYGEEGVIGRSAEGLYVVDTQPPSLLVQKAPGGASPSPLDNGDHFAPTDDADPDRVGLQMRICGATTAEDALDLPSVLGPGQHNFCVAVGTSSPACVPAASDGVLGAADGACVDVDCPGAGLFSLAVSLGDDAGNRTARVVENLTCASTNPSVQFLDPVGDSPPFADVTKRILAADNEGATRKDKNPGIPGAQYDAVACTTAAAGTGRLLAGPASGTPSTQVGTAAVVAAEPADGCPAGMTGKLVFADVTLPESAHDSKFELLQATRLVVEITDASSASGAAQVDIWVDSTNPALALTSPPGFCGSFIDSAGDVLQDLKFSTAIAPVSVTVNGSPCEPTCTPSSTVSFGTATVADVPLAQGTNQVVATTLEPSSNQGRIVSPCEVNVDDQPPPIVAWRVPVATSRLTASTTTGGVAIADEDPIEPGWQGSLKVCTNIDLAQHAGVQVQFSVVGGSDIGGPIDLQTEGAESCATLADATVPEGLPVQLRATTTEVNGAEGAATIAVPVDVTPPGPIAGITPSVLDRRATSFHLAWTAPADNLGAVTGYRVRVSNQEIDDESAFDAAVPVPYVGTPAGAGSPDGVDVSSLVIENDYYFAVAATDSVGNRGPMQHTVSAARAEFEAVLLEPPPGSAGNFGTPIDGSVDLDGDGYSDVIVGNLLSSIDVRVYFGGPAGPSSAGRSLVISGTTAGFGTGLAALDIDGDGRPELAIGSPNEDRVYVFQGRATWPAALSSAQAATVIRVASAAPEWTGAGFGISVARLGDFDGDGREDLAIGANGYASGRGLAAVVLGQAGGLGSEIVLPGAFGSTALRFEGEVGSSGSFGWSLLGLGHFYDGGRTDLIVSAPLQGADSSGRAFAFRGRAVTGTTIFANEADGVLIGATNEVLGTEGVAAFGKVGPLGQPAVGFSLPYGNGKGRAKVFSGTTVQGPFATLLTELRTAETGGGVTGRVTGGGFSGIGTTVSVIRGAAPDLILPSMATGSTPGQIGPKLFILSAETLQAIGGSLTNVEEVADVTYLLPSPWTDIARNVTLLRDVDGDGYADIAVGDVDYASSIDGKVLILH